MTESSVQQRFCGKCGWQASDGAAFCGSCGVPLSTPEQSADHAPEPPPDAAGEAAVAAQNETTEAVLALVFAENYEEGKRIVEERRDVLLTDAADEELAALIPANSYDEATMRSLEERRELLAHCRREGIDAAFAEYLQPPPATQSGQAADVEGDETLDAEGDETLDAVAEFVNARTWPATKLILKQNRSLLLTDAADEALSALIAQRRRDGEDVRGLEEHRDLLAVSRQKGIDAAFAENSQKKPPFLERVRERLIPWVIVIVGLYVLGVVVSLFG